MATKLSNARVNANRKYDQANMKSSAVRLTLQEFNDFTRAAEILNTTRYAILKAAVNAAIAQAGLDSDGK